MKTFDEYQTEAKRTATRTRDTYPESVRVATALIEGLADEALTTGSMGAYRGGHMLATDLRQLQDKQIWALGLAGEAGEVADYLKKVHGHGKPYDRTKLLGELGDVLWYLSNLADIHGMTLSEVAQGNVDKLRARHPKGFTVETANASDGGAP